jgi:hypothetical protein
MTRPATILFLVLCAPLGWAAEGWEGESRFALGLEYNSNLYEFEPGGADALFASLRAGGDYTKARQSLAYQLTVLDPVEGSSGPAPPSRMLYGGLEYGAGFDLGAGLTGEASARYQFRDAKERKDRYPVEEDPYTLFGAGGAVTWRDRVRLALDWSALDPEDHPTYRYRRGQASLQVEVWRGGRVRTTATAAYARYDYDNPVLVLPGRASSPPTPPVFLEHRDDIGSLSAGVEYSGPLLVRLSLFAQDADSTVPDLAYTSWGVDGALSAVLGPGWTLLVALRYEDRRLARSYLLFDPRVLTEAGTNYVAVRLRRALGKDLEAELGLGRYVHDVRQDFLSASDPRLKASLSLVVKL